MMVQTPYANIALNLSIQQLGIFNKKTVCGRAGEMHSVTVRIITLRFLTTVH